MEKIFGEIRKERERQNEKFGEQNPPCLYDNLIEAEIQPNAMCVIYGIPTEEEAKNKCDEAFSGGFGTYADIAIEEMSEVISAFDIHKRREELIQLTAVCVAWIEKIDRDIERQESKSSKSTNTSITYNVKERKKEAWEILTEEQKKRYSEELASDNWKKHESPENQIFYIQGKIK